MMHIVPDQTRGHRYPDRQIPKAVEQSLGRRLMAPNVLFPDDVTEQFEALVFSKQRKVCRLAKAQKLEIVSPGGYQNRRAPAGNQSARRFVLDVVQNEKAVLLREMSGQLAQNNVRV